MTKKDMPFFEILKLMRGIEDAFFKIESNRYGYIFIWSFYRYVDNNRENDPTEYQLAFYLDYKDITPRKCVNKEIDTIKSIIEGARYKMENFDRLKIEKSQEIIAYPTRWYMPVYGSDHETLRMSFNVKNHMIL
jgi:hypothetical protein